jgi:hypothetical protein
LAVAFVAFTETVGLAPVAPELPAPLPTGEEIESEPTAPDVAAVPVPAAIAVVALID